MSNRQPRRESSSTFLRVFRSSLVAFSLVFFFCHCALFTAHVFSSPFSSYDFPSALVFFSSRRTEPSARVPPFSHYSCGFSKGDDEKRKTGRRLRGRVEKGTQKYLGGEVAVLLPSRISGLENETTTMKTRTKTTVRSNR